MALVLADRVRDTTTTTGTGTVTLSGTAPTGYQTFGAAIGNGNTTYYTINAGSQWEVGLGTYSSTGPTLARTTVLASSNGGSLVDFSTGTKDVFVTYPAEEAVYQDGSSIKAGTAILGVPNGGTGVTTSTGTVAVVLSNSPTLVTPTIGAASATSIANALGAVGTPSYTFTGDTNTGIFSPAADTLAFVEGGVEAMRIDGSGNVGIGTSSPVVKLDVNGSVNIGATLISGGNVSTGDVQFELGGNRSASGNSYIDWHSTAGTDFESRIIRYGGTNGGMDIINMGTGGLVISQEGAAPMVFKTTATERMRITSNGNVGIGTSSPQGLLHVVAGTNDTLIFRGPVNLGTGGSIYAVNSANSAVTPLEFGASVYYFAGGNVGIGTSSPARTLSVYSASSIPAQIESSGTDARISIFTSSGSGGQGFVQASSGSLLLGSSNTERMRINSSGLVGIGTSSPQVGVHVSFADQSTNRIRLQNTGSGGGNFDIIGGLAGASNAGLSFFDVTNSATRMVIDSAGRVLIGTTATVGGTWSNEVKRTDAGVWPWGLNCVDRGLIVRNSSASSGFYAYFEYNGGTNNGSISWSGGTTSYNTTSDYRLKNINGPLTNSGAYIDALKPVEGSWKADGKRFIGLLAHQVQEVSQTSVVVGEKDGAEMQQMDYSAPELIANLIAEVQSLRARVAQLEGN